MLFSGPQLSKSRWLQPCFRKFRERSCYRTSCEIVDSGGPWNANRSLSALRISHGRQKIRSSRVRCTSIKSLALVAVQFHFRSFRTQWKGNPKDPVAGWTKALFPGLRVLAPRISLSKLRDDNLRCNCVRMWRLLVPIWPRTSQIKRLIAPLLSLLARSPLREPITLFYRSRCCDYRAQSDRAWSGDGLRPSPLKILIKSSTRSTCGVRSSRGKSNHLI